ncbi:hypothetical protein ACFFIY_06100 [Bhargavaea ullalensis]|uniref:DUF1304 domain-containing protein n=1 Tax=Bhargavaea ullalensis TaxID=1265685 RepID=A0ABV2GBT1_9BACL
MEMENGWVIISACMAAGIFVGVAVFQVLLSLGRPLGEYAMGGYHKVLPGKLRLVSSINAAILLLMGFIVLQHAGLISGGSFFANDLMMWGITAFLGLNTAANLASRSHKEKRVMAPVSAIAFALCLIVALS